MRPLLDALRCGGGERGLGLVRPGSHRVRARRGGEDMDRELGGRRVSAANEVDLAACQRYRRIWRADEYRTGGGVQAAIGAAIVVSSGPVR